MDGGLRYLVGAVGGALVVYGTSVVLRAERVGKRYAPWPGKRWGWVLVAVGVGLVVVMFFLGPSHPTPPPLVR